jgi:hypothetical protein
MNIETSESRWAAEVRQVNEALAGGDSSAALRAWHSACLEALGSQRWEPMLEVGEAAIRIGQLTGFTTAFTAKARQAYHVGLYRAHKEGAAAGVRRVGEAFAALGDHAAVAQCAGIAERLGAPALDNAISPRLDSPHPAW